MKMWLDDVRDPARFGAIGYHWVKTVKESQALLVTGDVEHASLDHDLGACSKCMRDADCDDADAWLIKHGGMAMPNCEHFGTGYDLVCWMERTGHWPKQKPRVHSMNPVGRQRMQKVIDRHYQGQGI